MNANNKQTNRNKAKDSKQEKASSGYMKYFYVLMLLLIASSSVIRIAGARHQSPQEIPTPTAESIPGVGGTVALVLTFHREESGTGPCEDLSITAAEDVIYSNCRQGVSKRYALNDAERVQLKNLVETYKTIQYERSDKPGNSSISVQLFLNGQGDRAASNAEIQQIIDFVNALDTKIASQS
jgi:hypothetical protein